MKRFILGLVLLISSPARASYVVYDGPTTYTPGTQGFGTPTINYAGYVCVNNMLTVWFNITLGTTTSTEARINLPSGYTWTSSIVNSVIVGSIGRSTSTATTFLTIARSGTTYINIGRQDGSNAGSNLQNGDNVGASTNVIGGYATGQVVACQ